MWYARVREAVFVDGEPVDGEADYGTWTPTGCANLEEAQYYIEVHRCIPLSQVVEWLKW